MQPFRHTCFITPLFFLPLILYPLLSPSTHAQDATLLSIAAAHNRSAAEVTLAWQVQLGVAVNPRSQNAAHMLQNLNFFDITLSGDELTALGNRPQY